MSVAEYKWQRTFCYFSRRAQFHTDHMFGLVINTMYMITVEPLVSDPRGTWLRSEHKHGD